MDRVNAVVAPPNPGVNDTASRKYDNDSSPKFKDVKPVKAPLDNVASPSVTLLPCTIPVAITLPLAIDVVPSVSCVADTVLAETVPADDKLPPVSVAVPSVIVVPDTVPVVDVMLPLGTLKFCELSTMTAWVPPVLILSVLAPVEYRPVSLSRAPVKLPLLLKKHKPGEETEPRRTPVCWFTMSQT